MYVWVLCEYTNANSCQEPVKNFWVYTDLQTARQQLRDLLRHHALSDNELFDGNGSIKGFDQHADEMLATEHDSERLEKVKAVFSKLRPYFLGDIDFFCDESDAVCWNSDHEMSFCDSDSLGSYIQLRSAVGKSPAISILIGRSDQDNADDVYSVEIDNSFETYDDPDNLDTSYVDIKLARVKVDEKIEFDS